MANIYPPTYPQHHPLDFHPRPVTHSPSPLAFGFGFAPSSSSSVVAHNALSPHSHHVAPRVQKRRLEVDDEGAGHRGDDAMDRSPTPERPKRGPPKRLRVAATETSAKGSDKDSSDGKDNRPPSSEVDVGVLLGQSLRPVILCCSPRTKLDVASLPQQSLLPLLMALLREQPGLKPLVLSLLPRPTLETALEALALASKTLREAYPYSAPSPVPSSSFGFGNAVAASSSRGMNTGFGSQSQQSSQTNPPNGGMRESYVISRLRPHISEFVSACYSYLPYFSYLPPASNSPQSQLSAIKPPAAETFTFLCTLTSHLFSQPQLTQNELCPLITPRLLEEWGAWVNRVDEVVNRQGGMFSGEVARGWERSLDEFAVKGGYGMREIRDRWVAKVGWLVGRRAMVNMDED